MAKAVSSPEKNDQCGQNGQRPYALSISSQVH